MNLVCSYGMHASEEIRQGRTRLLHWVRMARFAEMRIRPCQRLHRTKPSAPDADKRARCIGDPSTSGLVEIAIRVTLTRGSCSPIAEYDNHFSYPPKLAVHVMDALLAGVTFTTITVPPAIGIGWDSMIRAGMLWSAAFDCTKLAV